MNSLFTSPSTPHTSPPPPSTLSSSQSASSTPPLWLYGSDTSDYKLDIHKYKEMEEQILKSEKEFRENVRDLLSALAQRDQILAASRKAFQQLNKEVKLLVYTILKQIIEKEKEALVAKQRVLERLEEKINCIDGESDELEFIEEHVGEYANPGELILQSQALSILGDIQILERQNQEMMMSPPSSLGGGELSFSSSAMAATAAAEALGGHGQMEQITQHFAMIFHHLEWCVGGETTPDSTPVEVLSVLKIKTTSPRGSLTQSIAEATTTNMQPTALVDGSSPSPNSSGEMTDTVETSVGTSIGSTISQLCQLCDTTEGRKLFVNVLNQFRSKQVEVGLGFSLLGAVVWYLLTKCLHVNDVHNAKIVMILSQVSLCVWEGRCLCACLCTDCLIDLLPSC
jgi:hypothetical protein